MSRSAKPASARSSLRGYDDTAARFNLFLLLTQTLISIKKSSLHLYIFASSVSSSSRVFNRAGRLKKPSSGSASLVTVIVSLRPPGLKTSCKHQSARTLFSKIFRTTSRIFSQPSLYSAYSNHKDKIHRIRRP